MPPVPFYEVPFLGPDGKPFDAPMYENEIEALPEAVLNASPPGNLGACCIANVRFPTT